MTDPDADPDVLVAGETLVDFLPDSGLPDGPSDADAGPPARLADVERFVRRPGGAPANVAVALARLGPAPWFWTRVGVDGFGDFLAGTLAEHGLPGRFVERDPAAATTLAFVSGAAGQPEFAFYRDGTADTRLAPGTVPDDVLAAVDWCYVGGVALATEPSRSAILDLVDRAGAADCTVTFDPNARPELWGDGGGTERGAGEASFADVVGRLLERVDVVKATPGDLRAAGIEVEGGEDGPAALADTVCERGPHTALLTLGADGAVAHATDRAPWGPAEVRHAGHAVEAVDPTGAGDAFVAGAIRSLADGAALPEAVDVASAVAAASTTARGAMAALPDREAVRALRED